MVFFYISFPKCWCPTKRLRFLVTSPKSRVSYSVTITILLAITQGHLSINYHSNIWKRLTICLHVHATNALNAHSTHAQNDLRITNSKYCPPKPNTKSHNLCTTPSTQTPRCPNKLHRGGGVHYHMKLDPPSLEPNICLTLYIHLAILRPTSYTHIRTHLTNIQAPNSHRAL